MVAPTRGWYDPASYKQGKGFLPSHRVRRVRPVPTGHSKTPTHQRPRRGTTFGSPRPARRRQVGRAAGDGQPPVRHLLREEVPGARTRSFGAGGDRQRRAAQGGEEV